MKDLLERQTMLQKQADAQTVMIDSQNQQIEILEETVDFLENLISFKRNLNSDHARRKLDGRAEARLIEIACSPAPEGHSRWTLRLLEEQGRIVLDTPVGKNAIGRA